MVTKGKQFAIHLLQQPQTQGSILLSNSREKLTHFQISDKEKWKTTEKWKDFWQKLIVLNQTRCI
jgi:hypothetical protein